eukprot:UN16717
MLQNPYRSVFAAATKIGTISAGFAASYVIKIGRINPLPGEEVIYGRFLTSVD